MKHVLWITTILLLSVYHLVHSMKKNISMNDFGIKKLGRSIIDANVSQGTAQASGQFFQRVLSLGSGIDDRGVAGVSNAMEVEDNYRLLSKINKTFQQKSLLMTLESSTCGELYKLDRINLAASLESTLPCTSSFSSSTVRPSMLSAGGLMTEWGDTCM
jgi:hypothetical protein